jgi:hypothetical protein
MKYIITLISMFALSLSAYAVEKGILIETKVYSGELRPSISVNASFDHYSTSETNGNSNDSLGEHTSKKGGVETIHSSRIDKKKMHQKTTTSHSPTQSIGIGLTYIPKRTIKRYISAANVGTRYALIDVNGHIIPDNNIIKGEVK